MERIPMIKRQNDIIKVVNDKNVKVVAAKVEGHRLRTDPMSTIFRRKENDIRKKKVGD